MQVCAGMPPLDKGRISLYRIGKKTDAEGAWNAMRIIFVRHGEPDYEHDCLTETGKLQAVDAAERKRFLWSEKMSEMLR